MMVKGRLTARIKRFIAIRTLRIGTGNDRAQQQDASCGETGSRRNVVARQTLTTPTESENLPSKRISRNLPLQACNARVNQPSKPAFELSILQLLGTCRSALVIRSPAGANPIGLWVAIQLLAGPACHPHSSPLGVFSRP